MARRVLAATRLVYIYRAVAAVLLLPPSWQTTPLPSIDACSPGRTGFFPHPTSCTLFVACVHGQPFLMACPPGLHYSARLKLCDWPSSTTCRLAEPPPDPAPCGLLCPPHVRYYEFPDWTNCRRKYICMRGVITGPFQCPGDLHYDFLTWTCAYKDSVTCFSPHLTQ